jgi:hypothetical protein
MSKPKPELYKGTNKIVKCGIYENLRYYIKDGKVCPLAYIALPYSSPHIDKPYDDIDVDCHGGLTYSGELYDHKGNKVENFVIGWDYGHYGDFIGTEAIPADIIQTMNLLQEVHKWTIEEIEDEIKGVINKYKNYLTIQYS